MIELIQKQPPQQISIKEVSVGSNLSSDNYYGVEFVSSGSRGFVTRYSHGSKTYALRCVGGLTRANGWGNLDRTYITLSGYIWFLLSDEDRRVFQFGTSKELFDWLTAD